MSKVIGEIEKYRIMPIAVGLTAENAEPLADALVSGGLPILEITLRNEGAVEAVKALRDRRDITLGAGTILSIDQAKAAVDSGATYLVAPGLDLQLVEWSLKAGIPIIPGAFTGTELTHAYKAGLRVVKYFPAEPGGGITTIRMLAGPFPGMRFIPTGGITPALLPNYLESRLIVAVGQSAMVKQEWIAEKRWKEVTDTCQSVLRIARSVTPK